MDIKKFIRPFLTNAILEQRPHGRFEGVIRSVTEETQRNKFKGGVSEVKPVIEFECGMRVIPNGGNMRTLSALYGDETDAWVGHKIVVYLRPLKERVVKSTGELKVPFERAVMAALDDVKRAEPVRVFTDDEPPSDYDDSPEAIAFGRGKP
jgi:hypothetical protein